MTLSMFKHCNRIIGDEKDTRDDQMRNGQETYTNRYKKTDKFVLFYYPLGFH